MSQTLNLKMVLFSGAERLFFPLFICIYNWSVNTNIDAHLKENLNFVWKEIQQQIHPLKVAHKKFYVSASVFEDQLEDIP